MRNLIQSSLKSTKLLLHLTSSYSSHTVKIWDTPISEQVYLLLNVLACCKWEAFPAGMGAFLPLKDFD